MLKYGDMVRLTVDMPIVRMQHGVDGALVPTTTGPVIRAGSVGEVRSLLHADDPTLIVVTYYPPWAGVTRCDILTRVADLEKVAAPEVDG
jgi:hypothetical protein